MIDLHTHILPYVDDGAADLEMALEMGRYAASKGIRVIAATPHFYQIPDWGKIQSKVAELQKAFLQHQINVTVVAGAELFMDLDIAVMAPNQIPTYGAGGRYCLIELPLQQVPMYTEQVIFSLQTKGIVPIIAHPERYLAVGNDPNVVFTWIELGCLVQMNTGSILGRFGQQVQSTAEIMLTHNMVHFLGSDGHSLNRRRLNLVEGYEAARKIIGEEGAGRLVRENPEIVLKNEGFPIPEPRKYQKKKRFWFF